MSNRPTREDCIAWQQHRLDDDTEYPGKVFDKEIQRLLREAQNAEAAPGVEEAIDTYGEALSAFHADPAHWHAGPIGKAKAALVAAIAADGEVRIRALAEQDAEIARVTAERDAFFDNGIKVAKERDAARAEAEKLREAHEFIVAHYGVCPLGGCAELERDQRCVACISSAALAQGATGGRWCLAHGAREGEHDERCQLALCRWAVCSKCGDDGCDECPQGAQAPEPVGAQKPYAGWEDDVKSIWPDAFSGVAASQAQAERDIKREARASAGLAEPRHLHCTESPCPVCDRPLVRAPERQEGGA